MSKDQLQDDLQKPAFQQVISFECIHGPNKALTHPCFYDVIDWRAPKKGEHYLGGTTLDVATIATRDFPGAAEYWIVRATNFAMRTWYKGERV